MWWWPLRSVSTGDAQHKTKLYFTEKEGTPMAQKIMVGMSGGMEAVAGQGTCHVLTFRSAGSVPLVC